MTVLKPDPKHFRNQKFLFCFEAVLFLLFCIATYYLKVWNLFISLAFLFFLVGHLVYLINHGSKKIILTDRFIAYRSFLKDGL